MINKLSAVAQEKMVSLPSQRVVFIFLLLIQGPFSFSQDKSLEFLIGTWEPCYGDNYVERWWFIKDPSLKTNYGPSYPSMYVEYHQKIGLGEKVYKFSIVSIRRESDGNYIAVIKMLPNYTRQDSSFDVFIATRGLCKVCIYDKLGSRYTMCLKKTQKWH